MKLPRGAAALLSLAIALTGWGGQALPARPTAHACGGAATPAGAGSALAAATQSFGPALIRQLAAGGSENIFISPLSAQMALAMAASGARGGTRQAMLDSLGLGGLSPDRAAREAGALLDRLRSSGCAQVEIANGIWARRGLDLDPGYVRTVRSEFKAEAQQLDRAAINAWASRATHGKIRSLVDQLSPDLMLYLVNATYFHGEWQAPFDPSLTRQAPFHRAGAAGVSVPLMDRSGKFLYGEGPGYQAVALPYRGGAARMLVVLPTGPAGPRDFAPYLEPARMQRITDSLQPDREGELRMPRFSLDYRASLLEPLAALGMGPAFEPGADFSGMTQSCGHSCAISEVTHKTRVEVDENGTTAAAATGVAVTTAARAGEAPFRMVVDRPFLTAIQDTATGTLLFLGTIGNPS